MVEAPTPPFIQARNYTPGGNFPVRRIVIHGTVSPCRVGGAKSIARYFSHTTRNASAHYVVDPRYIYQCVNDWDIAWHAPPNAHTIGVELCDPQAGPDSRWDDANHQAMLGLAADLVSQLCAAYGPAEVWLMPDDLLAGEHGITDHENVSYAWGQTSHVDPGWSVERSDQFVARVRGEHVAPVSPPAGGGGAAPAAPAPEPDPAPVDAGGYPLDPGEYFGLISGPADSHGGYHDWEKPYIRAIQRELIRSGYVPGVDDPNSSWADGIYGQATHDAVTRFQQAERPDGTARWGEVWGDDWATLFFGTTPAPSTSGSVPAWPLPGDEWFGDINGGARSHGGYYEWEQPHVERIQRALIVQGYVPGIDDPEAAWADGIFGQPTVDAVAAWQRAEKAATTSYYGQVWSDDWAALLGGR